MLRGCSCCSPREVKRAVVNIGDVTVGLAKLDRVFEELYNLYDSKKSLGDVDGEKIVDLASFYNFIPDNAVGAYAESLLKEYRKFYRDKEGTAA
ncbi:hypothetical protein AIOGIFDO_00134 [Candidatus Methanoperedenaceae archaeon GB37]|nr:hypothetical protein AIOGIFDO_00134 [Candidatus Methanoperedenaceae archaeon GB37]